MTQFKIPKSHPRYASLKQREALVQGCESGVTALAGLIAHGRGEAFDYLLGEATIPQAKEAIRAAAAALLLAKNLVISVNGNTAVLCPKELVRLAKLAGAKLEVNLFYRSRKRERAIEKILMKHGAAKVYGIAAKGRIKGISSARAKVDEHGILIADVVLVPLEDGDRTEALVKAGKKVVAVDLNPLSRTSRAASITIVDNVIRAVPELITSIRELKGKTREELKAIVTNFDNQKNLGEVLAVIKHRLEKEFR